MGVAQGVVKCQGEVVEKSMNVLFGSKWLSLG